MLIATRTDKKKRYQKLNVFVYLKFPQDDSFLEHTQNESIFQLEGARRWDNNEGCHSNNGKLGLCGQ